jgi:hypothetical protein
MANDQDRPEKPRAEPEIIPPDRSGRRAEWQQAAWPYGPSGGAGMNRIYVTRVGPFGVAMLTLVLALLTAAILLVFAGAIVIWLPVIALLIVVGAVVRFLRG